MWKLRSRNGRSRSRTGGKLCTRDGGKLIGRKEAGYLFLGRCNYVARNICQLLVVHRQHALDSSATVRGNLPDAVCLRANCTAAEGCFGCAKIIEVATAGATHGLHQMQAGRGPRVSGVSTSKTRPRSMINIDQLMYRYPC